MIMMMTVQAVGLEPTLSAWDSRRPNHLTMLV